MSLSEAIGVVGLEVLTGIDGERRPWHGALAKLFDIGEQTITEVNAEIRAGRLGPRSCLFGRVSGPFTRNMIADLASLIDEEYPIVLQAPFEDTASVAGAVWPGCELFGTQRNDGVLKLRFERGTLDLPLHVHEQSDRYIVVLRGDGVFHYTDETLRAFTATNIHGRPVRAGDVLVFTRGLLHTFSAPTEDLLLLSYHNPLIPLNDAAQYTLPILRWTPAMDGGLVH
ncbi:MAG: cupin domain-containing protein [Phycisphaerales bacterium]|nr:cupin domain-containing protein [Phycisphaerales bacterium]